MIFPPHLYHIRVLGKNAEKASIIATLQELGIVHFVQTKYNKELQQDTSIEGVEKISKLLLQLQYIADQTSVSSDYTLNELPRLARLEREASSFVELHLETVQQLASERTAKQKELQQLEAQAQLLEKLPEKLTVVQTKSKTTLVYTHNKRVKIPLAHERIVHEKTHYYVFYTTHKSAQRIENQLRETALKKIDCSFFSDTVVHARELAANKIVEVRKEHSEVQKELNHYLDDKASTLTYLITALENYHAQYTLSNEFQRSDNFFIATGYCEKKDLDTLRDALPKTTITAIPAGDEAPTKLANGFLSKHFQPITELFSTPKHNALDPTRFITFFYPLFFGIMLSDIGYGLLLLLVLAFISKKLPPAAKPAIPIMVTSGISTIIFGLIFGSFFGGLIQIPAIYADPFTAAFPVLLASLGLGLFHMNLGVVLGIIQGVKQGRGGQAIALDAGPFILLQLAVLCAVFGQYIPAALIALILLGILIRRGGFLGIMDISGYLGTWFSYARLLALALATAGVALAINTIAQKSLAFGTIGIVLWLVIIVIGHAFNFVVNLIGVTINAARLHYVEWFGLFFDGGGETFSPFKTNIHTHGGKQHMAIETMGLIAVGAGIAIGFAGLGSGIGQGIAASAAAGATAENEKLLAKMLVFAALPETQAIYGFVIAIILLFVVGA